MAREGLLRILDQARERSFDLVIVEAFDRLSRDMEDLAGIHKRLASPSAPLMTCFLPR